MGGDLAPNFGGTEKFSNDLLLGKISHFDVENFLMILSAFCLSLL